MKDEKQENRIAYGIDLWETKSTDFLNKNGIIAILTKINRFDLIKWDRIDKKIVNKHIEVYYNDKKFKLQAGDLLYRNGHVEFYLGNNKVVSWGRVHKTYLINKGFYVEKDGYYSEDSEDNGKPYVAIIRFRGDK